jgi:predicted amidophosphoribosyltransferase
MLPDAPDSPRTSLNGCAGWRPRAAGDGSWRRLRSAVAAQECWLRPPLPPGPGVCAACRGPARPDYLRCFNCGVHAERARGLLADAVVPVSYAVKGGKLAHDLWIYKSALAGAGPARAALRALLLVFLRDHCGCVWRLAGGGRPTHLAVVPSVRGRRGQHPLRALTAPVLALPWTDLVLRAQQDEPDPDDRDLSLDLFSASRPLSRAQVLLLDDTWTTGSRAQSAAAALKLAGAGRVVVVVLGRHLGERDGGLESFGRLLRERRYCVSPEGLWPCPAG